MTSGFATPSSDESFQPGLGNFETQDGDVTAALTTHSSPPSDRETFQDPLTKHSNLIVTDDTQLDDTQMGDTQTGAGDTQTGDETFQSERDSAVRLACGSQSQQVPFGRHPPFPAAQLLQTRALQLPSAPPLAPLPPLAPAASVDTRPPVPPFRSTSRLPSLGPTYKPTNDKSTASSLPHTHPASIRPSPHDLANAVDPNGSQASHATSSNPATRPGTHPFNPPPSSNPPPSAKKHDESFNLEYSISDRADDSMRDEDDDESMQGDGSRSISGPSESQAEGWVQTQVGSLPVTQDAGSLEQNKTEAEVEEAGGECNMAEEGDEEAEEDAMGEAVVRDASETHGFPSTADQVEEELDELAPIRQGTPDGMEVDELELAPREGESLSSRGLSEIFSITDADGGSLRPPLSDPASPNDASALSSDNADLTVDGHQTPRTNRSPTASIGVNSVPYFNHAAHSQIADSSPPPDNMRSPLARSHPNSSSQTQSGPSTSPTDSPGLAPPRLHLGMTISAISNALESKSSAPPSSPPNPLSAPSRLSNLNQSSPPGDPHPSPSLGQTLQRGSAFNAPTSPLTQPASSAPSARHIPPDPAALPIAVREALHHHDSRSPSHSPPPEPHHSRPTGITHQRISPLRPHRSLQNALHASTSNNRNAKNSRQPSAPASSKPSAIQQSSHLEDNSTFTSDTDSSFGRDSCESSGMREKREYEKGVWKQQVSELEKKRKMAIVTRTAREGEDEEEDAEVPARKKRKGSAAKRVISDDEEEGGDNAGEEEMDVSMQDVIETKQEQNLEPQLNEKGKGKARVVQGEDEEEEEEIDEFSRTRADISIAQDPITSSPYHTQPHPASSRPVDEEPLFFGSQSLAIPIPRPSKKHSASKSPPSSTPPPQIGVPAAVPPSRAGRAQGGRSSKSASRPPPSPAALLPSKINSSRPAAPPAKALQALQKRQVDLPAHSPQAAGPSKVNGGAPTSSMDVDEMVGQAAADDNEESELSELEEDGQQGEGEKTDEDEGEVELTESMMPLSKLPSTVLSARSAGDEDGRKGKKRKTTDGEPDGKATKGGKGKKKLTTNADTIKPLPMHLNKRKASSSKAKTPAPAPPVASSPRSKPKAHRLDVSASGSQYDAFETYNPDDTQYESLAPPSEPSPKKKTPYTNNKGRGKGKERALPTPTGTGLRRGGRTSEARDYSEITDDEEETPIEDILPPTIGGGKKGKGRAVSNPFKTASSNSTPSSTTSSSKADPKAKNAHVRTDSSLQPTARVLARYSRDGHFYPGTVVSFSPTFALSTNATSSSSQPEYSIFFDDETEEDVKLTNLRRLAFSIGDIIRAEKVEYTLAEEYAMEAGLGQKDSVKVYATHEDEDGADSWVKVEDVRVEKKHIKQLEDRLLTAEEILIPPGSSDPSVAIPPPTVGRGRSVSSRAPSVFPPPPTFPTNAVAGPSTHHNLRQISPVKKILQQLPPLLQGAVNRPSKRGGALQGMAFVLTECSDGERLKKQILQHGGVWFMDFESLWAVVPTSGGGAGGGGGKAGEGVWGQDGFVLREDVIEGGAGAGGVGRINGVYLLSDMIMRKPKTFKALALGVPCVLSSFIDAAIRDAKHWRMHLLPTPYSHSVRGLTCQMIHSLFGTDVDLLRHPSHHRLEILEGRRLLHGLSFMLVTEEKEKEERELVTFCLVAMGAETVTVSTSIERANLTGIDYLVLHDLREDESVPAKARKALAAGKLKVVDVEWVKQSVIVSDRVRDDLWKSIVRAGEEALLAADEARIATVRGKGGGGKSKKNKG